MAKSKESFNKKEKEKKKQKQRQEKEERKEERKAGAKKGKSLEEMMAYIDENGNISDTPPDPSKARVFNSEDIEIGVPKRLQEDDPVLTGTVSFFNLAKGFGFIMAKETGQRIFVHINNLKEPLNEGDKVSFEVEMGDRGPSAINVNKI
jgi:cold shock CspA family protein